MYGMDEDLNKKRMGLGSGSAVKAAPSVDMGEDINGGRIMRGNMKRADNGAGGTPNPSPGARSQGSGLVKPGDMRTSEGN